MRAAKYVGAISDALARADALVAAAASDAERAAALETRAAIRVEMQAGRDALADAEQALALCPPDGELPVLVGQRRAMALMQQGRHAEALPVFDAALARIDAIADAEGRVDLLVEYAILLDNLGRRRDAVAAFSRAHDEAMATGCLAAAADALNSLGVSSFYLGRIRDALRYAEQARALGPLVGAEEGATLVDEMTVAVALHDAGRYAEALALYQRCADGLKALGYHVWAANAENNLADLYALLGQPQRGKALLGDLPPELPALARVSRLQTRARLAQMAGQPALALFDEALEVIREGIGREYFHLRVQTGRARELPPDEGARLCRQLLARCIEQEYLGAAWPVRAVLTDCLRRAGDTDAALEAARGLVAFFDTAEPAHVTEGEVWWTAAQAFGAAGHADEARHALAAGRAWLHERALPQVPEAFRDSFLHRNPVNRELLAAAARLH